MGARPAPRGAAGDVTSAGHSGPPAALIAFVLIKPRPARGRQSPLSPQLFPSPLPAGHARPGFGVAPRGREYRQGLSPGEMGLEIRFWGKKRAGEGGVREHPLRSSRESDAEVQPRLQTLPGQQIARNKRAQPQKSSGAGPCPGHRAGLGSWGAARRARGRTRRRKFPPGEGVKRFRGGQGGFLQPATGAEPGRPAGSVFWLKQGLLGGLSAANPRLGTP